MRLKQKSAVAVIGSFLAFGVIAFALFQFLLLKEFKSLEDQQASRDVSRVSEAFQQEIKSLIERTRDWAVWDDAYKFVTDHSPDFIESNLSYEAVKSINFNHIIFLSSKIDLSYGVEVDFTDEKVGPLSGLAHQALVGSQIFAPILRSAKPGGGILRIGNKTYLVAASPITDSAEALPPNGILIFSRELTDNIVARIAEQTKLEIERQAGIPTSRIDPIARDTYLDPSNAFILEALTTSSTAVVGDLAVVDLFGENVFRLRIPLKRDLYFQGVRIRNYIAAGLGVLALFTALLAILLIDRLVISRVAAIGEQLEHIADEHSFSGRVAVIGSDELTSLATGINQTLGALENAQVETTVARATAERANAAKSMFIARVSHELRTPVAGIIGLNDMLQKRAGEQRGIKELLGMQGVSAEGLLTIINEILDFSTIEQGKLTFENIEFEPRVVVKEALQVLAGRLLGRTADAPLQLVCDINPNVARRLKGDPTKLKQILVNLIGNGIKFTQRGNVGVSVNCVRSEDGKSWVQFDVWDTGIGIPANKLATVFEPFTQADESVKRKYQGTGLGLTIVKQMTEGLGGSVTVESVEGKGSVFKILMPFETLGDAPYTVDEAGVWPGTFVVIGEPSRIRDSIETGLKNLRGHCAGVFTELPVDTGLDLIRKADLVVITEDAVRKAEWLAFVQREVEAHRGCIVPVVSLAQGELRQRLHSFGVKTILSTPVLADDIVGVLVAHQKKVAKDAVAATTGPALPTHTRPLRILVADDTPTNRLILEDLLTEAGHTVVCVDDGQKLVDRLRPMLTDQGGAEKFDIVLTDISMPIMDGYSATEAIRAIEQSSTTNSHIPVIAITAHVLTEEQEKMKAAGMDDVLTKPIRAAAVAEVFRNCVRG